MHQLHQMWIRVTSSLWFVPLTLVFGAIALAMGLIATDLIVGTDWVTRRSLAFGVGASGARGMLSAIAGSMMTVASLTFSLTIATLATASAQYTSRLTRNFMRDRINQFVLGYFVGLFAYCLVVLRTIRSGDEEIAFVPPIAVMGGLLLALVSIAVLIFFIHHIAESIQLGVILRRVTTETLGAIDKLFPAEVGEPAGRTTGGRPAGRAAAGAAARAPLEFPPPGAGPARAVSAERFGYVQSLDAERLLRLATEVDGVVRMTADIGSFVTPEGVLCEIASQRPMTDEQIEHARGGFDIGAARTIEQDAAFGIRQIVDIALKALSPGVNDTTTAVMCTQHLGVVLEALAARPIPDQVRGEDGAVRLLASGRSFELLAGLCLDQIRQSASGNTAVIGALLCAIGAAGRQALDGDRRRVLSEHARLIGALAEATITAEFDAAPIRRQARAVVAELGAGGVALEG